MQFLWRSFCYYAYHPVPSLGLKVDLNAFKRATNLLVFQCDDLIVSPELDDWRGEFEHIWRYDQSGFDSAAIQQQYRTSRIERLFRSIGKSNAKNNEVDEEQTESTLTDAMDILAMCGPEFLHSRPTTEQWKALAKKLFPGGVARKEVKRDDVFTLISLLIRLRLKKEKWGTLREFYNHGEIVETNPAYRELTNSLVNSLIGYEAQERTKAERNSKTIDLIVSDNLKFWSVCH
jgi:hypothetical protein